MSRLGGKLGQSFIYRVESPRRSRLPTFSRETRFNHRNVPHRTNGFQQVRKLDDVRVIDAVAALTAQKLNVTIGVMNEDQHRGAIKNVAADDSGPVVSVGISGEVDHPDTLQSHS